MTAASLGLGAKLVLPRDLPAPPNPCEHPSGADKQSPKPAKGAQQPPAPPNAPAGIDHPRLSQGPGPAGQPAADHWERQNIRDRQRYAQLTQHITAGERDFTLANTEIKVQAAGPGCLRFASWDHSPNTGWATETFEEYSNDQGNWLHYSRYDPGSAFSNDLPVLVVRDLKR